MDEYKRITDEALSSRSNQDETVLQILTAAQQGFLQYQPNLEVYASLVVGAEKALQPKFKLLTYAQMALVQLKANQAVGSGGL